MFQGQPVEWATFDGVGCVPFLLTKFEVIHVLSIAQLSSEYIVLWSCRSVRQVGRVVRVADRVGSRARAGL